MAFNPDFAKGATLQQIRDAMNYSTFLISPEREKELREEKAVEAVVETGWKEVSESKVDEVPNVSNQVVYPAGPVGVPYEHPPAQRITGTSLYNNN
jgi:hypothetical protein